MWIALPRVAAPEPGAPSRAVDSRSPKALDVTRDTIANTATVEHSTDTFVAGGRVVRVVETEEQVELRHGGAKVRVSLLAARDGELHLHVKGINCFVARNARHADRRGVARARRHACSSTRPSGACLPWCAAASAARGGPAGMFRFGASSVRVPQPAVLIDFEERQELLLIQQARGT